MKITNKFLIKNRVDQIFLCYMELHNLFEKDILEVMNYLLMDKQYNYLNWLIIASLNKKSCMNYLLNSANFALKFVDNQNDINRAQKVIKEIEKFGTTKFSITEIYDASHKNNFECENIYYISNTASLCIGCAGFTCYYAKKYITSVYKKAALRVIFYAASCSRDKLDIENLLKYGVSLIERIERKV